ncbi:MAG TPA: GNAT family N-acetyltransferase [Flavisolibacter sp.]|nr:GNAT family N-acetyltransferase [Flavisolibacter sp.]
MLQAVLVNNIQQLEQIQELNRLNLKRCLTEQEQKEQGFVSWAYSLELLAQMNALAKSIIVTDDDLLAGYALTTLPEASRFHKDLNNMFKGFEGLLYKGRSLLSYRFYCMGQICIAKDYRGKGLVSMLYNKHKEIYSSQYDFILTEIAIRNTRSLKAHEKIGFKTIHVHRDHLDEWAVVVWDWT